MNRIRIAIVHTEDAARGALTSMVTHSNDMEIVESVLPTTTGINSLFSLKPDIVLLENIHHVVDYVGLIKQHNSGIGVLIISPGKDHAEVERIVLALSVGAFDFITEITKGENKINLLLSKIRCCSIKQFSLRASRNDHGIDTKVYTTKTVHPVVTYAAHVILVDAILIGVSTGGPEALIKLLPQFPENFPIPIIIVLHMPKEFTHAMAVSLDKKSSLHVVEACDNQLAVAGTAYLAQGGIHCALERDGTQNLRLRMVDTPAENGCKPAVDVLFKSSAAILGKRALAVVLTGMGNDGTKGAHAVKSAGATILVQDEQSSVVWGMPGSVAKAGLADEIVPLNDLFAHINERIRGRL